jgi:hypothetical protein
MVRVLVAAGVLAASFSVGGVSAQSDGAVDPAPPWQTRASSDPSALADPVALCWWVARHGGGGPWEIFYLEADAVDSAFAQNPEGFQWPAADGSCPYDPPSWALQARADAAAEAAAREVIPIDNEPETAPVEATVVPTVPPTQAPPSPTEVPTEESAAFQPLCYFVTDAEAGAVASYAIGRFKLSTEGQILPDVIYTEAPVGGACPSGPWGLADGEVFPLNGGSDDGNSTPGGARPTEVPIGGDEPVTSPEPAIGLGTTPGGRAVVALPRTGVGGQVVSALGTMFMSAVTLAGLMVGARRRR